MSSLLFYQLFLIAKEANSKQEKREKISHSAKYFQMFETFCLDCLGRPGAIGIKNI